MLKTAVEVIETLEKNGYEAYFIGGSIRNQLHNITHNANLPIKDYDIVTNASYEQVNKLFEHTESRGAQFNVAIVKLNGIEFEVAQYRGESYPEGGSLRPDNVFPVQTLKEDVARRDFTINGIAATKTGVVIDHENGKVDIENKLIRAIGNPDERFAEDPLRIMRAFRFMSQLDYHLETQTKQGIERNKHLLNMIPHERMKEETHKILRGEHVISALTEMRALKIQDCTFLNSIENKQVSLFPCVLDTSDDIFDSIMETLNKLDRSKIDISEIYYAMYCGYDYDEVEQEIKDMMFLNEKELNKTILLLKHRHGARDQYASSIYSLVQDIGEQRGMSYLKDILESYKRLHQNVNFSNFEKLMKRPLFKSQLSFNGNDLMEMGKEFDLAPGKWVGDVLDNAQELSVFGREFNVEDLVRELVSKNED